MIQTADEIHSKANAWLDRFFDTDTRDAVRTLIEGQETEELTDAFYKDLEFGTGGLRGLTGPGTNRMNIYTVGRATQGLADHLKATYPDEEIKVAVSCDSRHYSDAFADVTARVFAANGFTVYRFKELRPTPLLSFAIRQLGCHSGVMITASHNPKEYNGYKAYWKDGGQLVAPHDKQVIEAVNKVQLEAVPLHETGKGEIIFLDEKMDQVYIDKIKDLSLSQDAVQAQSDLSIVFSPIHGTGITLVPKALQQWGFHKVAVVKEQEIPDGNFSTVIYPNPEEEEAMSMALQLGKDLQADLVLATDPDADRVGVGVRNTEGNYILLNGNQIGSLLVHYVLHVRQEKGLLSAHGFTASTIVTTGLIKDISAAYNVPCYEVLTGFKYIGELITGLEGKMQFLAGGEESYGYLVGDLARDKDAVVSCCFIAEMTAWYKQQGHTLYEGLQDLYRRYGFYKEKLVSLTRKGKAGNEEIKAMMEALRANPPALLAGIAVTRIADYKERKSYYADGSDVQDIGLPVSDVLQFSLADGTVISARPSGTEPKIKFYCSTRTAVPEQPDWKAMEQEMDDRMGKMIEELVAVKTSAAMA